MLKDSRRPDGRAFDEIRTITCEVGVLPRTHGSAIFTRGETQALVTTTLGTKDDEQRIEMFDLTETSKRFMLHYNFPPFSVGEVDLCAAPDGVKSATARWPSDAFTSLPDEKTFPYTCACQRHPGVKRLQFHGQRLRRNLSLMDAGVPIGAPVAGIAMGLCWKAKIMRF